MSERGFFLIVIIASYLLTMSHSIEKIPPDKCPKNARIQLAGEIPDESGLVIKFGYIFPPQSIWYKNGEMFGCLCNVKPCLPLCCPLDMVKIDGVCVKDNESNSVNFSSIYSSNMTFDGVEVNPQNFHIITSDPCSSIDGGYLLEPNVNPDEDFHLMKTGSLYLPKNFDGITYNFDQYCFWRFKNSTTYSPKVCFEDIPLPQSRNTIIYVGMIVSILFLLITLIIYKILPEMKNMYGLTTRGYVGCLFVGYTAMAVIMRNPSLSEPPCKFAAYTTLFSFLASFYWLNVMCFHIWGMFRCSQLHDQRVKQGKSKKCLIYSVYVWGCASFYTAFYVFTDYTAGTPDRWLDRPGFAGVNGCWFRNNLIAQTLYFYGPMGVTCLCNIFFLISTAVKSNRDAKNTVRFLEGGESDQHDDKKRWFYSCLVLFIVMSINWSMELISWFCNNTCPKYFRTMTHFGHAFHGIIIFIILISNKNIIRLVIQRFGYQVPNFLNLENSTRNPRHGSKCDMDTTSSPLSS